MAEENPFSAANERLTETLEDQAPEEQTPEVETQAEETPAETEAEPAAEEQPQPTAQEEPMWELPEPVYGQKVAGTPAQWKALLENYYGLAQWVQEEQRRQAEAKKQPQQKPQPRPQAQTSAAPKPEGASTELLERLQNLESQLSQAQEREQERQLQERAKELGVDFDRALEATETLKSIASEDKKWGALLKSAMMARVYQGASADPLSAARDVAELVGYLEERTKRNYVSGKVENSRRTVPRGGSVPTSKPKPFDEKDLLDGTVKKSALRRLMAGVTEAMNK